MQYVVTIINSSDGSVYLNITISDTNTTVTLPTGVEYCVTVLGVDSIGRRGPPSQQQCYTYGEYNYYINYYQQNVINVVLQFQVQDLLTLVHVCLVYSHIECIVSIYVFSATPSVDPPPSGLSGGAIAGVVSVAVVLMVLAVVAVVHVLVIVVICYKKGVHQITYKFFKYTHMHLLKLHIVIYIIK